MRRRRAVKRELVPDVKYNSELVARLINTIMTRGKKSTAQNIVYGALDVIQSKKPDMPAIDVFMQALENVKPKLEVKSRRVGGATYQVPIEVDPERQVALAMRWITTYSRSRPVLRSRRKKIPSRWRRRTRRSPITAGKRPGQ